MIYKQIEIPIHILNSIKNMQKYAKNQVAVKFPDYDLESFSLNNNVLHLNLETKKVSNRPKSYDKTKPSRVVETVFIPVEAKIQMADLLNYTANSFGVEYAKLKTKTRIPAYVNARRFFFYCCINYFKLDNSVSGAFVNKDKNTVRLGLDNISKNDIKIYDMKFKEYKQPKTDTEILDFLKIDRAKIIKKMLKNDNGKSRN